MTAGNDHSKSAAPELHAAQPPAISGIGLVTADRPALLERAIGSYIAGTKGFRSGLEYIVFDDSKEPAGRRASFEVARAARERFDVDVRFAGFEERAAYARRLREISSAPAEILEYALLLPRGYTLGQNRNALLLDTVGTLFFSTDDDTIHATASSPLGPERSLKLWAGSDPADFWCFKDAAEARSRGLFVDADLLQVHEQLLGRNMSELNVASAQAASGDGPRARLLSRRTGAADCTVKITLNGLLGDCAWGAPFGLWHEPMGYLAFEGPSLDRLTCAEEFYHRAILSRQVMRVTRGPVLSDASFSMLTFWGLDNRELLPPNLPNLRGQDLVFGQVLWESCSEAVIGHVPLALAHSPEPSRRFWPGEVLRSAAGIDSCRLMIEALRLCRLPVPAATPAARLVALGRHLTELAELPHPMLGEKLMERLRESNRLFESQLQARARERMDRSRFYAEDVARYCAKLKVAQAREDYWMPLDNFSIDGSGSEERVRRAFRQFGELLANWPSIVEAARILRSDGRRLSRPV